MPIPPPRKGQGPAGQRSMGLMMFLMLLGVVLFSAVSQQVALHRQKVAMQQKRWKPAATDVTLAGVRAVGDGLSLALTQVAEAEALDAAALAGATAPVPLAPEAGALARLGSVTFGVAMLSAVRAEDFDRIAEATGDPATLSLATSLRVDPEAPPTYLATLALVTDHAGAFDHVTLAAFDQQGVPVREAGRRSLWDGRVLLLTLSGVLPGDVAFVEVAVADGDDADVAP